MRWGELSAAQQLSAADAAHIVASSSAWERLEMCLRVALEEAMS